VQTELVYKNHDVPTGVLPSQPTLSHSPFENEKMGPESKVNISGVYHTEMQRKSISTAEMETTFDPLVCKRLKLKADCILIPLLSLAY
jgi:hypothetical protein